MRATNRPYETSAGGPADATGVYWEGTSQTCGYGVAGNAVVRCLRYRAVKLFSVWPVRCTECPKLRCTGGVRAEACVRISR
jgi:hypothetical protein